MYRVRASCRLTSNVMGVSWQRGGGSGAVERRPGAPRAQGTNQEGREDSPNGRIRRAGPRDVR
ncbi:hypothetical protein GCM10010246_27030 [Streptomyces cuspidosporus]|uniref:Uncharacterized protein n=1 Tax=Streptomyces cuspidosporus TaxID=66882 RepID=A0ABN3FYU7_9ACTN